MMIGIMPDGEAAGGIVGFFVASGLGVFSSAWYNIDGPTSNIHESRVRSGCEFSLCNTQLLWQSKIYVMWLPPSDQPISVVSSP